MKRKEIVEELSKAVCNCLVNAEENPEAVKQRGAKPAVLRGMAYGMSVAIAALEDGDMDFSGDDPGLFVFYAALCDSHRGEDMAERVGRLIGHEVTISDGGNCE